MKTVNKQNEAIKNNIKPTKQNKNNENKTKLITTNSKRKTFKKPLTHQGKPFKTHLNNHKKDQKIFTRTRKTIKKH